MEIVRSSLPEQHEDPEQSFRVRGVGGPAGLGLSHDSERLQQQGFWESEEND